MSKSLGNVVSPDDMVGHFGGDATRMYTLFATSPDRELDWQDEGVAGIYRFLSKVYRFAVRSTDVPGSGAEEPSSEIRAIQRKLHQTIKRVTDDFQGRWHFNTSIAAIMELVNELSSAEGKLPLGMIAEVQKSLALLLAPFAPYLAHELWEMLGETSNLLKEPWPKYDAELAKEDEIEIPVQVNGKLRGKIVVAVDTPGDEVIAKALAEEKVHSYVSGKEIVKKIFTGKLVSIVVR
jgi:leucyl-tRNA synthetase